MIEIKVTVAADAALTGLIERVLSALGSPKNDPQEPKPAPAETPSADVEAEAERSDIVPDSPSADVEAEAERINTVPEPPKRSHKKKSLSAIVDEIEAEAPAKGVEDAEDAEAALRAIRAVAQRISKLREGNADKIRALFTRHFGVTGLRSLPREKHSEFIELIQKLEEE